MREPRVGCGAVIRRDGKLLLVKRRRQPEAGHWGLPGGKVDWLEPVADAVAREVAEEIGLVVHARRLLLVVDQIDRANAEHWVAPVFLIDDAQGEPTVMEPEALDGCGWFSPSALPSPLTKATRDALRALERLS